MQRFRRVIFWTHLALGILTGLVGLLMAGTAVIMAFADTYLDMRDYRLRHVPAPPLVQTQPRSLETLASAVRTTRPERALTQVGLSRHPSDAVEFYDDQNGLYYVDPFTAKVHGSDSVPLRRKLHKGVEQWHRFFGFTGEGKARAKLVASWFNVAFLPLLVSGLVLWWPRHLRWSAFRAALMPLGAGRGAGTQRSWHTALGFWSLPFLLVMVLTATPHSFAWVRDSAYRVFGSESAAPGGHDGLWARTLPKRSLPVGAQLLSLDEIRAVADRERPHWTRLDIFPNDSTGDLEEVVPVRILVRTPGDGPGFFPTVLQIDAVSGDVLDVHAWKNLSGGTKTLAWSRWLHKGEAFGRTGQIVAGLACLIMMILIGSGWWLALRRLRNKMRAS